jgi:hypothetical protein
MGRGSPRGKGQLQIPRASVRSDVGAGADAAIKPQRGKRVFVFVTGNTDQRQGCEVGLDPSNKPQNPRSRSHDP